MEGGGKKKKPSQSWLDQGHKESPPQYRRVVKLLTNDDLKDEMRLGLGTKEFQQAVRDEAALRGIKTTGRSKR